MDKITEKLVRVGLVLVIAFVGSSCSKDDDTVVPEPEYVPSVYMAGEINTPSGDSKAVIWKDGTQIFIENLNNDSSSAKGIFVNDNDVYATGEEYTTKLQAVYWKNGNKTVLGHTNSWFSNSYTIFVDGDNVYVGGEERMQGGTGYTDAVYWRNGVKTILPITAGKEGRVTSIVVKNGVVYACGYESLAGSGYMAKLWVNGVATNLESGCSANDIFIDGSDVYVCGDTHGNPIETGRVWRNGVATNYTASDSVGFYSIEVKNGNVYIAGAEKNTTTGNYNARYWVNNTKNTLPASNNYSEAIGIALYGSDIYIGGSVEHNTSFEYNAKYWKNNTLYDLTNNDINNYSYTYAFTIK